jgi:hypothetical protein
MAVPGMDCPAEEQTVRLAITGSCAVAGVSADTMGRRLTVVHRGSAQDLLEVMAPLGPGARVVGTRPVPAPDEAALGADVAGQRSALAGVLAINASMFVIELLGGLWARSAGVVATPWTCSPTRRSTASPWPS